MDCLQAFCLAETLEGNNKYFCEKCNQLTNGEKAITFYELPEVKNLFFIFHFKLIIKILLGSLYKYKTI